MTNLFDIETEEREGPVGYERTARQLGPLVGASDLGASVYVLGEGQSTYPYHWEANDEEWLLVLEGHPELRMPDAVEELEPGDLVCFPRGPEGAHKVTNRRPEPARVLILSTKPDVSIAFYPDSGKVGIWPPGTLFRLDDAVDYWDGERG